LSRVRIDYEYFSIAEVITSLPVDEVNG